MKRPKYGGRIKGTPNKSNAALYDAVARRAYIEERPIIGAPAFVAYVDGCPLKDAHNRIRGFTSHVRALHAARIDVARKLAIEDEKLSRLHSEVFKEIAA